jgi:hypothetical protein
MAVSESPPHLGQSPEILAQRFDAARAYQYRAFGLGMTGAKCDLVTVDQA